MNRIFISTICVIGAIFLCIFCISGIKNITIPIIDQIEIANNYAKIENFEKTEEIMKFTNEKWKESENFLSSTLRLEDLNEINNNFVRSIEYSKNGDSTSFLVETSELIHRLENLFKKELLNFKNIF